MKKGLLVLLGVVLCLSLTGCESLSPLKIYEDYQRDQETVYVAFSKEGEENDPIDYRVVAAYQSVYSDYNARVLYNALSPAEQQLYRLFEYALDNGYTEIFFDSRLLADCILSPEEILIFYSMDSPLVQQNYRCSLSETQYTFSYFWEALTFEVTGEVYRIENFSQAAMAKKEEAVTAAEKVYATMPQGLSQLEQARFFYRYLIREVKYTENKADPGEQHNLYDAFVRKQTQCDGFANAFSLLCGMARIPCAEKIVSPEKEGEVGHTWNVFCADGVWYNADLSLSEDYAAFHRETDVDFSFGFPDGDIEDTPDWAERFPACTADLLPVELTVSSPSDPKLLSGLKNAFKKGDKQFVHIGLEKGALTTDDLQRIADYLQFDIRSVDETIGGRNYYYIFRD